MATAVLVWCVGSFLLAPLVGRAIRDQRPEPAASPNRLAAPLDVPARDGLREEVA
jgi:hypothetical protein